MKYELSIEAAAKIIGVSESRISQLVSDGTLKSTTIRGNRRINRESAEEYARQRTGRGRKPTASRPTTLHFTLMNAQHEVMDVLFDETSEQPLICQQVLDPARAPLSVLTSGGTCKRRELNEWWWRRSIPASRPGLDAKLAELGVDDSSALPLRSLGLSLSDRYWLRPKETPRLAWAHVNYFDNDFAGSTEEDWDDWLANVGVGSPDNTSEGELPKKWVSRGTTRILIKGSRNDDQRPFNEAVATALHERILAPDEFVRYEIVLTHDGPASACPNFLGPDEEYVPAVYVKELIGTTRGSSTYDRLCRCAGKLGMDEANVRCGIGKMIVCDRILANNDRHWRNFGFIRNVETLEMRLAPLFDSGNCLWYWKTPQEIERGDYSFASKPFHANPDQQLSLIEHLEWFDADMLDGFATQATEILSASAFASDPPRRAFIEKGLSRTIADVRGAASVLRYR